MAFVSDAALDATLDYIRTNGTQIHTTTSEVASYAAIAAAQLGEVAITISANADGTGGRKVTSPEFTVTATGTGDATHWALSNNSDTLVATGALASTVSMTTGVDYTFPAADIFTNEDAA